MFSKMSPVLLTTFVCVIIFLVAAIYLRGKDTISDGEIGLELGVPTNHAMVSAGGVIPLPIVVRLKNLTGNDIMLKVANPCKLFRFIITDRNGTFIQASGSAPECETQPSENSIIGHDQVIEEIKIVELDAKRYQEGAYLIQTKFWGYSAEGNFNLVSNQ